MLDVFDGRLNFAAKQLRPKCLRGPLLSESLREDSSTGYGLRFDTEIYGSKREKTVFHEYQQDYRSVLPEISEHLRKPPGAYGRI